jgi:hypothetical protein
LETLLIEGNPFVGPWKTLSQTLLSSAKQDAAGIASDEHERHVQKAINATALRSFQGGPNSLVDMSPSAVVNLADNVPLPYTGGPDEYKDVVLDSERLYIGERVASEPQSLRRMRSAGALLGLRSFSGNDVPTRENVSNGAISRQSPERSALPSTVPGVLSSDDEDDMEMLFEC